MDSKNIVIKFPDQATKKAWPAIYDKIKAEVKEPITGTEEITFEERIRGILRTHLDMDLVKSDEAHRKLFKDILKYAIDLQNDKIFYKIEKGRARYGNTGLKEDKGKK